MTQQALVSQIRSRLNIAEFVAPHTRGLKRTKDGWYIGHCPFHQPADDKPTKRKFWVNVNKGICGCFVPRCQDRPPMDIINFYARLKNISNREAIHELAEMLNLRAGAK